jgi:hypothetical protein
MERVLELALRVQRQHHSDVSVHQRSAIFRRHDHRFTSRLPFGALLFRLG